MACRKPVDWNVINDMIFAIPVRILDILVFNLPFCPSPTLYIEVNSKRASVKLTAPKLINFGVSMEKLWPWRISTCFLLAEAKSWRLGAERWEDLEVPSKPGSLCCSCLQLANRCALSEAWSCSLQKEAWEFFQEKHKSEFRPWKVSKEGNSFKIF